MVLLTITPSAKSAIELYNDLKKALPSDGQNVADEPSLDQPSVGDPISHAQLIEIARFLKEHGEASSSENISFRLDALLKGSKIYTPPPQPKPEPVRTFSPPCLLYERALTMVCI